MEATLSRSVVPPGGFIFDQALVDGSFTRIEGGSFDQVLERILAYRLANGMVLGESERALPQAVERDYNAQVCGKYPWLCTGVREGVPAPGLEKGSAFELLITRISRWLSSLALEQVRWVDQKSAAERAQVCLGCPQNVFWETGCSPCNQQVRSGSSSLRGARRLALDSGLKGCRSFGTLQEVAVWMETPGGEAKYAAPPFCWRRSSG
jgi:hypothetical protein